MEKYYVGSTPYLEVKFYDKLGALADPATNAKVTVKHESGTTVVDDQAMSQSALYASNTGIYYYKGWTVLATSFSGKYYWYPKSTDATIISIFEGEFEVIVR